MADETSSPHTTTYDPASSPRCMPAWLLASCHPFLPTVVLAQADQGADEEETGDEETPGQQLAQLWDSKWREQLGDWEGVGLQKCDWAGALRTLGGEIELASSDKAHTLARFTWLALVLAVSLDMQRSLDLILADKGEGEDGTGGVSNWLSGYGLLWSIVQPTARIMVASQRDGMYCLHTPCLPHTHTHPFLPLAYTSRNHGLSDGRIINVQPVGA